MIPRFGSPRIKGQHYVLRPGAYAVLLRGDALLLTHTNTPQPEFQLPGGGIDPGESPVQALHREVMEETGYAFKNPKRLGAFRRFTYMPDYGMWAEKLCHIYTAEPTLRRSEPLEPDHTTHWVDALRGVELIANEGDRYFAKSLLMSRGCKA